MISLELKCVKTAWCPCISGHREQMTGAALTELEKLQFYLGDHVQNQVLYRQATMGVFLGYMFLFLFLNDTLR